MATPAGRGSARVGGRHLGVGRRRRAVSSSAEAPFAAGGGWGACAGLSETHREIQGREVPTKLGLWVAFAEKPHEVHHRKHAS